MKTTFDRGLPTHRAERLPTAENRRAQVVARVVQIVSYLFGVLYVLIGFEFVLELFAARDRNGFKQLLDAVTEPFLGPFRTLLPTMSVGGSEMIFSYLVALAVYGALHLGIIKLAKMLVAPRPLP